MKKFFIITIITISLFATQKTTTTSLEKEIISKILHAVIHNKKIIKVYLCGKIFPKGFYNNKSIDIVKDKDIADLIIVNEKSCKESINKNKPIIVLNYRLLKEYPLAIGAYYWQKGRPNIVMIKPRIQKMGITLPSEFERYVESYVW